MEEKQNLLSSELANRLAAIDIGTNSIRLIVAEPLRDGTYRILDEGKETTRLGEGLSATGRLDARSMEKSLAALRRMKQIAEGFQVTQLRAIATCAVREAKNGEEFRQWVKAALGLDIEVISAREEALLAFSSVQRAFELDDKHHAVVDIGGGSTEIVVAFGNFVEAIHTPPLGAVRLTEQFGNGSAGSGKGFERLMSAIDRRLRKHTKKPVFAPQVMFGSGGTFTSLAGMVMAGKGQVGLPMRGYQVTRAEVSHLLNRLRKLPVNDRAAVSGLSPDRADIIVAGLAIIDRVMERFDVNMLQVHNRGVRDGLLLTMVEQSLGLSSPKATNGSSHDGDPIDRLVTNCGGGELNHGRHVARLAGAIFSELAVPFGLDPKDRRLLEAAARLRDVGYLINYDQHHKHSYHLILNSRLAGFQPHELELVANIARYHRGSTPKRRHANFRQLSPADQRRVRQLSAILRIAGGLDRSNSQQVQALEVRPKKGKVEIRVADPNCAEVDIWDARRRTGLFEKVFDTKLKIGRAQPSSERDS